MRSILMILRHFQGTVVTVVDGQLHSIVVDCRDVLDSASQVAVLYDELESREAQFEDVEKENAQLCDLVDEVNQELMVAKDEVVKLEEAAVAAVKVRMLFLETRGHCWGLKYLAPTKYLSPQHCPLGNAVTSCWSGCPKS